MTVAVDWAKTVFCRRGVCWTQTDNGGHEVADASNDQMLAVIAVGAVGRSRHPRG